MGAPLISVAIPTRDRADTLAVTLATLADERSDRIEIVVHDNSRSDATDHVVKAAQGRDPRIRYVRQLEPCSQRLNFELALKACLGDYLAIIGDDDAFCAGALPWLAARLDGEAFDAVRWNRIKYVWPSLSRDGTGFFDLVAAECAGGHRVAAAAALAERAIRAETAGSWDNLLIYHGMIARRVYERLVAHNGGRFFDYQMPDVYAHNVLPLVCETYLQVDDVMTVYGLSGHSAGSAWTRPDLADSASGDRWVEESRQDPELAGRAWSPGIRTLRYHDLMVLDRAVASGLLERGRLDCEVWIQAILAEIGRNPAQRDAFVALKPSTALDRRIVERVRQAFPTGRPALIVAEDSRFAPDPRIPSLRVRDVDPAWPDTVAGAVKAAARLHGGTERYDGLVSPAPSKVSGFRGMLVALRRRFPLFSSRILNSRFLPHWLWRHLKTLEAGRGHPELQQRLDLLHRKGGTPIEP